METEDPGRTVPRSAIALLALTLLPGCGMGSSYGEDAKVCAQVVKTYLGLPNTVTITRATPGAASGAVTLDYESANAENIPVRGTAACTFGATDDGGRGLLGAVVNGETLSPDAIGAINASFRSGP